MIVFVRRRSNSSARLCCTSGRAPGCRSASLTICCTSAGSISTPTACAGRAHGVGQLGVGQRRQCDGAAAHRLAEARRGQRPIEVVGAQRHDDAHVVRRRARHAGEQLEERPLLLGVDHAGEQLLELVDDDEHDGVARHEPVHRRVERATRGELAEDVGNLHGGHTVQRRGELLERRVAGGHLRDEPTVGPVHRTGAQRGDEPGLDDR